MSRTGIAATKEQILSLKDGLKRGVFSVDVFPEIGRMFENQKNFMQIVKQADVVTYDIELDRTLKISILETLKSGVFPLYRALPTLEQEAKRSLFFETLQAASLVDDEGNKDSRK